MIENRMNNTDRRQFSWLDLLSLGFAFFGSVVSFWGALVTYFTQAEISGAPLWPLPGLVLLDWVLLGLAGFITTYLCFRQGSAKWLRLAWLFTGTLIPLIILGAFSIGLAVLIAFLLFVISTIIFAVRKNSKLLESFGLLMLGAIVNLGVLAIMIALGNSNT